jgi:asparagine synthase (glutamine-hydrolysing)
MISRLTRKYVTVALGGDGGDELFGGYNHYQNALRQQAYLGWLPSSLFKLISEFASILPAGTKGRNYLTSLKKGPLQSSIWGSPYFDVHLRKKLFTPGAIEQLGEDINLPEIKSLALYNEGIDPIDKLTRLDFQQVLPDDFLVKVDRASMANSLEVRTPFLDYRLIENNFKKISSMQKVNLSERRILQNLMAKKYLPKNFEFNRKQGFSIPIDQWMKNISFKDVSSIAQRKFFNEKFIKELISGQSQKKTNGSRLFSLIMLNLMEN